MKRKTPWQWVILSVLFCGTPAGAQETVSISIPASLSFSVFDVSTTTTGWPNPFSIAYSDAQVALNNAIRISVRANAAQFTPPNGNAIPASLLSWTVSNARGGMGTSGALSATDFTQVYQSNVGPTSGGLDLTWRLGAPGAGIRAGNHTLAVTWKIESITP